MLRRLTSTAFATLVSSSLLLLLATNPIGSHAAILELTFDDDTYESNRIDLASSDESLAAATNVFYNAKANDEEDDDVVGCRTPFGNSRSTSAWSVSTP